MILKVLGHAIVVMELDGHQLRDGSLGSFCGNTLEIKIERSIPKSQQEETFFHEVLEACNYFLELGMEHQKIQALGAVLHQIFVDNFEPFRVKGDAHGRPD